MSEWSQIEPLPILSVSPDILLNADDQLSPSPNAEPEGSPPEKETTARSNSNLECFVEYVRTVDLSVELLHVVCHADMSITNKITRMVFGPKSMKRKLKSERNRIFALALKAFDNSEPLHSKMLTSVYQSLRHKTTYKCPRIGCHWEEIGFQGMDPASDLRGVGILGLFQLTFFVQSQQTAQLARDIYDLSTRKNSDFPFCVMGLNMTQIALHHLREGTLNREINRTENPLLTFNLFYSSLFMKLSALWKGKHCTVVDTGFLLRDLKQSSGKAVRKSILAVSSYKSSEADQTTAPAELVVFSDIGNIVNPDVKGKEEEEENLV